MDGLLENTVIINLADYRRMVEGTTLNQLKADKLQRRIKELVEEADGLRGLLDAANHELEKAEDIIKEKDALLRHWYEKCMILEGLQRQ